MMKKIVAVFLLLVICCGIPVSAADEKELLVDQADVLTLAEEKQIESKLEEVSDRYDADIVILTVYSLGYRTPRAYADDFFDYKGYGRGSDRDGVILLVSLEDRDWWISTSGACEDRISESDLDTIEESILPGLRVGDYSEAFLAFAEECGNALDFEFGKFLLIAAVIGLIAALIVTGVFKAQLKSVRAQSGASNYVRPGSMQVTRIRDIYLYKNVSRRPKPQNNGSSGGGGHRSSSGRSHGGRGGKF